MGEDVDLLAGRVSKERLAARDAPWPCDRDLHNRMADLYRAKLHAILRKKSESRVGSPVSCEPFVETGPSGFIRLQTLRKLMRFG